MKTAPQVHGSNENCSESQNGENVLVKHDGVAFLLLDRLQAFAMARLNSSGWDQKDKVDDDNDEGEDDEEEAVAEGRLTRWRPTLFFLR